MWSSCTQEPLFDRAEGDAVSIGIASRILDGEQRITFRSLRFLAFDGAGHAVLNQSATEPIDSGSSTGSGSATDSGSSTDSGSATGSSTSPREERYKLSLLPGTYEFFVVINEPADLTATLNAVTKRSHLDGLKIRSAASLTEADLPLMKQASIRVRSQGAGSPTGEVSTDGGAYWSTEFTIHPERLYAKTSLFIKKNTTHPGDAFTIKKVELVNIPAYSFLIARDYDGNTLLSRVMYEDPTGISFTTNDTTSPGTELVAVLPVAPAPSNLFPEYHLSVPADADKAMHYLISAQYKAASGATFDVVYKIPLRRNLLVDDYSLHRNDHYEVTATVTKRGQTDDVQINYTVRDWSGRDVSVDIRKDPFLDVSNVEVNAYDAAITRVYFYTNQPASQVYIKEQLSVGSIDGNKVAVKDLFYDLVDEGRGAPRNFSYTVDPLTGLGEGYIDIVNLHTSQAGTARRILYLKSGLLERAIAVNSILSAEVAKQNPTPYVGTFHRSEEKGERIVTWHAEGEWSAEIVNSGADARALAAAPHLRIDRFASPAYYSGGLYGSSPIDAEGADVTDGRTDGKLYGRGRIYFRVGWDSPSTPDNQRHAQLKVTYQSTPGSVEKIVYLYCRQGEEPDRMAANDIRFAAFNVDTPETFVPYPSLSGNLYQWNKTKTWPVTGSVNAYPGGNYNLAYDSEQYICPPKYAYPNQAALSQLATLLTQATYQWGYYADGYFDRRGVDPNSHTVIGRSGELASAGGLLHFPATSVGLFLPTTDWRDRTGTLAVHGRKGSSGHYWSAVMQDADGNAIHAHDSPGESTAIALHLGPHSGSGDDGNRLEFLHKASALNVRCIRLEGNTFYFDANGGKNAPRTVTTTTGTTVRFPAGTKSPNPVLEFDKWADHPDGSGSCYSPGDEIAMTDQDKTWYATYKKVGFAYEGNVYLLSPDLGPLSWTNAMTACTTYEGGAQGWLLPERDLLVSIYREEPGLFPELYYWSATVYSNPLQAYYLNPYFGTKYDNDAKTKPYRVRCVKKING